METTPTPITHHVGIDVAAATLAVVLLAPGQAPTPAVTVANAAAGWRELHAWLRAAGCRPAATRLVMEATGSYWVGAATALTAAGWAVSVVSPASARDYAKARLVRAKTDAVDAAGLAAYGRDLRPAAWTPAAAGGPGSCSCWCASATTWWRCRRPRATASTPWPSCPTVPAEVLEPAEAVLAVLAEQIARLDALIQRRAAAAASLAADVARLDAIKGVGLLTAAIVLTELWGLGPAVTPAQAVAYAGLDPRPRTSRARRCAGRATSARPATRGCGRRCSWPRSAPRGTTRPCGPSTSACWRGASRSWWRWWRWRASCWC